MGEGLIPWWQWRKRNACPHLDKRGIYGDEIIFGTPNFNRLQCRRCGRFLDGPVSLSSGYRGPNS